MLQILIVSRYYSERSFLIETFQHSFGDGSSDLWFRTSPELVDQDEAAFIAAFHHDFHIGQVRRISTQVIFDGLFVTDIDEDTAEHTCMTAFVQRNQHTALQHILLQTDCFQTDRLSSGIGTGNDKDTLLLV